MKTMMKLIAALLIAAMMTTGAALAAGQIRTEGNVNVRKGPGLGYDIKGTVSSGKVLNYDDAKKDGRGVVWYHITNGKGGWVSSRYASQVSGKSGDVKASGSVVKATGDVFLRKGPGLGYKEIDMLGSGSTAAYLGEAKKDERGVTWYKVSFNGRTGWVSSKYGKLMK